MPRGLRIKSIVGPFLYFVWCFSGALYLAHSPIEYEYFINRPLLHIDDAITDTPSSEQSGLTPLFNRPSEFGSQHRILFSVLLRISFFRERIMLVQIRIQIYAIEKVWFVEFYGISTFVGYLTPNPFLCI